MLLPALIWAGVIFYFSTRGVIKPPAFGNLIAPDKLGHAVAYFLLASLLAIGMRRAGWSRKRALIWAVAISSLYGIAMETVQWAFFPNRYFEVYDIIANIIGSLTCVLLSNFFIK